MMSVEQPTPKNEPKNDAEVPAQEQMQQMEKLHQQIQASAQERAMQENSEKESAQAKEHYKFSHIKENTIGVLQRKIEHAQAGLKNCEQEYRRGSWGKRFDSAFKLGGLFGTTVNQSNAEALRQQKTALEHLQALLAKTERLSEPMSLPELLEVRRSLGLPDEPIDMQRNSDEFVRKANAAFQNRDRSLEVNWKEINEQLKAADTYMDWLEWSIQTADTGMSIATGFVPGGAELYAFSHSMTDIATGMKTPKEALMEVGFTVVTAHLGGRVLQGKMGAAMTKKITEWAEKNAVNFVKNPKLAARLAAGVAGAGSGAAGGAVIGGGSAVAKETWNVATGQKTVGQGLSDVAKETAKSAVMGAGMGAAGGATGLNQKIHETFKDDKSYKFVNKWLYGQRETAPAGTQRHASQEEITQLKDFLKTNPVDDATRLHIAEQLLGRALPKEVTDAILVSHGKPGAIDEGNMTNNILKEGPVYDALRAEYERTMPAEQAHERAIRETKLILDAGLCGAPPPPPRKERALAQAEQTDMKTTEGRTVFRVRGQGKEFLFPEGHIVIVEKGTSRKGVEIPANRPYEIRLHRGQQGQLEPTLHPLDPSDQRAGDYSIDLDQTTWRTPSASVLKDWKAIGWRAGTPEPPPPKQGSKINTPRKNIHAETAHRKNLDRGVLRVKQHIDELNAAFRTFREHVKGIGTPDMPEDLIYSHSLKDATSKIQTYGEQNGWKPSKITEVTEQLRRLHARRAQLESEWNPPSGSLQTEINTIHAKIAQASLPQQIGKRLKPAPEALTYPDPGKPGIQAWLCERIGDFKAQTVHIFRQKDGSLALKAIDETNGLRQVPLTDKFRKALAPVHDLQAEAISQEPPESGWKLHLNFDGENLAVRARVAAVLRRLEQESLIANWKIGHRGGKRAGAPGKEATIYIGHGKKAKIVSKFLDRELADVLRPPEGDTLGDDIRMSGHVVGRFDLNQDPYFHQYGGKGIPFLMQDVRDRLPVTERAKKADKVLRQRYGEFYSSGFEG